MHSHALRHFISLLIFILISASAAILFSKQVDIKVITNKFETHTEETLDNSLDAPQDQEKDEQSETDENTVEITPEETFVLKETKDYGSSYVEKIIFLGDKNTYAMGRYTYTGIPDPIRQVWSVENNVSPSKISVVNNFIYPASYEATNYLTALKDRAPAFLVLSFGSYCEENEILTKDRLITSFGDFIINVKQVSPNTQIMIQSIFPVSDNCTFLDNEAVLERNEWLRELCSIYKVYYIDSWSALTDESGRLNSEYASDDGYLLNEEGYKAVIDYVKTHAHPLYVNSNEY